MWYCQIHPQIVDYLDHLNACNTHRPLVFILVLLETYYRVCALMCSSSFCFILLFFLRSISAFIFRLHAKKLRISDVRERIKDQTKTAFEGQHKDKNLCQICYISLQIYPRCQLFQFKLLKYNILYSTDLTIISRNPSNHYAVLKSLIISSMRNRLQMKFKSSGSSDEVRRKPTTSNLVQTQNSSVFATYEVTATILLCHLL